MVNVNTKTISFNTVLKLLVGAFVVLMLFHVGDVFAGGDNIGKIAENITQSFKGIGQLILAIAFVAGIGFVMAAIFKFKQHKDNPTQIPLGTPIALLAVGVALIFLPNIINPAGQTLFGKEVKGGGFEGAGVSELPK
ncbi:MAG: type IV secretion protein IcmD [Coxiellaceae bacterium]|nr:type IV secretion protein IcmD [Coxiellaceae bacterium]